MPVKVYISSAYTEFKDIRQSIFDHINKNATPYELIGMENYSPEDRSALSKCIEDVQAVDVYVCLLGFKYGSEAKANCADDPKLSYTHWEYNTASDTKSKGKRIERLIYLKEFPGMQEDDPRLTDLKKNIKSLQTITCRIFQDETTLPELIIKDLNNYVSRIITTNKPIDLIYACDREVPNLLFEANLTNDPVQFFLLHGHDKDMPHYFIKRKKLDFIVKDKATLLLELQTNRIIEDTKDYTVLDKLLKAAIYNKLPPGSGMNNGSEVTIPALIRMMERMNLKYLLISWHIQSIHWKADFFLEHIKNFYESCKQYNGQFTTERKIIFFGIAKYNDNSRISEEEFDQRVAKIQYGNYLPKFTKISLIDVKNWLVDNWIEPNPEEAEDLIEENTEDLAKENDKSPFESQYYFSRLEGYLKAMILKSDNQN